MAIGSAWLRCSHGEIRSKLKSSGVGGRARTRIAVGMGLGSGFHDVFVCRTMQKGVTSHYWSSVGEIAPEAL